ncbi:cupin-like domain-containing protein [Dyadobacter tibetensis]|uniref:cupin-like domain-containing protein n=1 Tax=Dyadobacter tibetensis TaxID=1211851 RepID=UPI00047039E4|nr:cupin-like domain-containing protein [Dyadobacter tibetensis]
MELLQIEKRSGLTREEFIENYLKPSKPVVFTDLAKDWPAVQKWTFDWLRENHGDLDVPLVDKHMHDADKYFQIAKTMKFGEYLSMIEKGPTDLRIFLFDIFKKVPELADDIRFPTIMDGFLKSYKFVFFGGQDAITSLHYDMDCSNVFLTQFQTRKQVILFSPEESKKLYHHPFTVMSKVDPLNPDYERFPALKDAVGHETILGHGETIFIPSLWWHHIKYVDGGFSLALRANNSVFTALQGGMNLVRHTFVDRGMTSLLGLKWQHWKERKAVENAQSTMVG